MNGMSVAIGPTARRGRRVRPGSFTGFLRVYVGPASRKSEPSAAGEASKALRSTTTAPGK